MADPTTAGRSGLMAQALASAGISSVDDVARRSAEAAARKREKQAGKAGKVRRPHQLVPDHPDNPTAALDALEQRIVPIGELLGQLDHVAEQIKLELEAVAEARRRMDAVEEEVDRIRNEAATKNINLRGGPSTPTKTALLVQIRQREDYLRQLFVYPLRDDAPEAEAPLRAFDLYRRVHFRRLEGADFGAVSYVLSLGVDGGFYRVMTAEEVDQRANDPEQADIERRTVWYGGKAFVLVGRGRGFWLLHTEVIRLKNEARRAADAERDIESRFLAERLPTKLRPLLAKDSPPPEEPVTFGVAVDVITRKKDDGTDDRPLVLYRTAKSGARPCRGVLLVQVSAVEGEAGVKQIEVRGATGSVRRFLPRSFEDKQYASAKITARGMPEWAEVLCTYLYYAGTKELERLRERWCFRSFGRFGGERKLAEINGEEFVPPRERRRRARAAKQAAAEASATTEAASSSESTGAQGAADAKPIEKPKRTRKPRATGKKAAGAKAKRAGANGQTGPAQAAPDESPPAVLAE